MARTFIKDPDSVLDYTMDWDQGWLDVGETISTSSWTASPTGITIDSTGNTTTTATVTLSGGTHGQSYIIKNKVVTNNALTGERSIRITAWDPR